MTRTNEKTEVEVKPGHCQGNHGNRRLEGWRVTDAGKCSKRASKARKETMGLDKHYCDLNKTVLVEGQEPTRRGNRMEIEEVPRDNQGNMDQGQILMASS